MVGCQRRPKGSKKHKVLVSLERKHRPWASHYFSPTSQQISLLSFSAGVEGRRQSWRHAIFRQRESECWIRYIKILNGTWLWAYTWVITKGPEINVPQSIFKAMIKGKWNHFTCEPYWVQTVHYKLLVPYTKAIRHLLLPDKWILCFREADSI